MSKHRVSIVRYEKPLESVRKAVELSKGLDHLSSSARVYVKPNIVFWTTAVPFPKWGVITTSRLIEDMLAALHQAGIEADPGLFENIDQMPKFLMGAYKNKPEYDEAFFRIKE